MEEIVRAFNFVLDQGWAFYWGTSEWSAEQIRHAQAVADRLGLVPPVVEQPQYNLLHRERVEVEYAPLYASVRDRLARLAPGPHAFPSRSARLPARAKPGLGTTIWSPLASGVLTGAKRTDHGPACRCSPFLTLRQASTTTVFPRGPGWRLSRCVRDQPALLAAARSIIDFALAERLASRGAAPGRTPRRLGRCAGQGARWPPLHHRSLPTRCPQLRALGEIADELGCSQAQLAIAWVRVSRALGGVPAAHAWRAMRQCLKNPQVSTVILGASRVGQLEENLGALEVVDKLDTAVMARIEQVMGNTPVLPKDWTKR